MRNIGARVPTTPHALPTNIFLSPSASSAAKHERLLGYGLRAAAPSHL